MINSNLQSKTIQILRFPLIVGVIFIHSNFNNIVFEGNSPFETSGLPIYSTTRFIISELIARISVPTFFFISGFLFFYKKAFTPYTFLTKLKKRFRTLLIPYLFWNIIVIFLFFLIQTFFSQMTSGNNPPIKDYSLINFLKDLWSGNNGSNMPINNPLWFLRDLIVVSILSPIIYKSIKIFKIYFITIFLLLWMSNTDFNVPGLSIVSIFFFSLGAYFSIFSINFCNLCTKLFPYNIILYCFLIPCILTIDNKWIIYLQNFEILIGLTATISIAYILAKNNKKNPDILTDSSFFIYVYHILPLAAIIKISCKLFAQSLSDYVLVGLYFICPLLIIILGILIYQTLQKLMPRFTSIILGGR